MSVPDPKRHPALAALLLVTAVWGTTFPAMKSLSAHFGVLKIILLRLVIASLVQLPLLRGVRRNELGWGALIGCVLYCAFYLQVTGLTQTSSNRNAFVTGLNVLIVPLLGVLGQRSQQHVWELLYLGAIASALMVWLQAWGQHRVRAVEAAILYGLEPVFAALVALWWIGESMNQRAMLGGAMIVAGVMLSQYRPADSKLLSQQEIA